MSAAPVRRAAWDRGPAHPVAGAVAVAVTLVALGLAFGVFIGEQRWSWLTTMLGATAIAGSVVAFVCRLPNWSDDEDPVADAVEARAVAEYPVDAPTSPAGFRAVPFGENDWRPGMFGYASEQEIDDVERAVSERERRWAES